MTRNEETPRTESALEVVSMFGVGGAVLTFALAPLLVPGIALLILFTAPLLLLALPLIPVAVLGAVIARAVRRRRSRRARAGMARPAHAGARAQAGY